MKIGYNKIESLDIYSGFSTKDVCSSKSPELSKFITNLPTLRSFYSNVLIDPAAVRHLSLSRNLTTLSCRIPELQTTHCPISTLECLRDINICAPNLDSCTSFLKAIQAPSLQSLELQCNAPCTSSTVHACLEAVSAFPRLRCLRLWADRVAYAFYQPKPCAISAHTLALLYGLRELEELHVEEHIELDLCDDDVLELARAWPAMGKLVFMACAGAGEHDGYPRLTPRALAHVAKHCPRIHQLGLPFDAAECGEALRDGLDAGDRGECLRTLDVHPPFSYVDEPREVAVFLHRLFPGLQAVRFTNTDAAVSHGWLHVAALLRAHTHADWEDHLV
ncbi:hypothetical protein PsYK624_120290 [Phanerochaete sordida]|uniref:Uncharacterized protein n=1 Tax=Phanerochaete sordida TaxID=48140 RepID=A0A9P3GLV7_9APHY|nr:hypothetical protein PsYK624_120290 [Phanerochaete sordida]